MTGGCSALSRAVVWLEGGRTRRLERGFAAFEAWRDAMLEEEATERARSTRKIAREEDWLRYGVTARRKRNQRRLAELQRRCASAGGSSGAGRGAAAGGDRGRDLGRQVIVAEDVGKSFGGPDRWCGISRPASCAATASASSGRTAPGKTTLLGLLTGTLAPDTGEVRSAPIRSSSRSIRCARALDPARTLADTLTGGGGDSVAVGGEKRHVVCVYEGFPVPARAGAHAGGRAVGRRARAADAGRARWRGPSNLLVLDEPTNDLDLETLDLLQEMLAEYAGTVLLVSHDRDFLDRVVTSTIGGGGRRALGGVCRRLYGHARAARRRRRAPAAAQARRTAPQAAPSPARARRPQKMSFKDRHALREAARPHRGACRRASRACGRARPIPISMPATPRASPRRRAALAQAEAELAEAEERWLALEMLREELEGPAREEG